MERFLLLTLILVNSGSSQWGAKVGRERVVSLRRGEGTYNPKSAWRFVDSRRRVLPDIDGKVHQVTEVIEVTLFQLNLTSPVWRTTFSLTFATST